MEWRPYRPHHTGTKPCDRMLHSRSQRNFRSTYGRSGLSPA